MDWLLKSFANDPAGWIALAIVVIGILFSAIFWRRVRGIVMAIGRFFRRTFGFAKSLRVVRVTDKPSVPDPPGDAPRRPRVLPPARWIINVENAQNGTFSLKNHGVGSIALDVQLDPLSDEVQIRSGGFWEHINGGETGRFSGDFGYQLWLGAYFAVTWTDGADRRLNDTVYVQVGV